ncbi:glycosyltransferase family 4 protein [bacterium]|nr:glycosyltransferase family 4 protein [bacterium]
MTEKRKVTHIINALTVGGAQSYLKKIVTSKLRNKYKFEVIAFKSGRLYEELRTEGIPVKIYDLSHQWMDILIPVFSTLGRDIKNSDLVHLHLGKAQFYGNLAQFLYFNSPSLVTVHGLEKKRYNILDKFFYPLNQRYLFVSEYLKNHKNFNYIPESRRRVIYPASSLKNTGEYSHDKSVNNSEKETIRLLWCGRFADVKGMDLLVELVKRLDADHQGFSVDIIGSGPDCDYIRSLAGFRMVNFHDDSKKEELYFKADIIINTSYFESIGISNIDGLKSGKCVIGFNVGGINEVIIPGNGYLVKPFEIDDYLFGLEKLKSRIQSGNIDRDKIDHEFNRKFSTDCFLHKIEKEYESVIEDEISSKKKVLFFVSSNSFGGGEKNSVDLAKNLDKRFWEPVFLIKKDGILENCIDGFETHRWDIGDNFDLISAIRLRMFCSMNKIDLIHTHLNRAAILSGVAGVPVVSSVHGLNRAIYYKFADRLIAVCNSAKSYLIDQGMSEDKIVVINNFTEKTKEKRIDFKPAIISVGRFHEKKRFDVSIKVLEELDRICSEKFDLYLVGDGDEKSKLSLMAEELGLSDRVIFTGYIENVFTVLKKASFFLLPSEVEAFPISLLEAMSEGCIPVVNDVAGMREIVTSDNLGIISEKNVPSEYAKQIAEIWEDRKKLESISSNVQKYIEDNFVAEKILPKIESLYREVLDNSG